MAKKNLKIMGWSVSFGIIAFFILYFFVRALDDLFDDFLSNNATTILIITAISLVLLFVFGFISFGAIMRKGKRGLFT